MSTETRQVTDPDHIVCITDPGSPGDLCAVSEELVAAGWKHAVEQRQAGSEDWPEMFPMLVSFLGGVQHYLGHQLGGDHAAICGSTAPRLFVDEHPHICHEPPHRPDQLGVALHKCGICKTTWNEAAAHIPAEPSV